MIASDEQTPYILALSRIQRLGPAAMRELVRRFGTPRDAWRAPLEDLRSLMPRLADSIAHARKEIDPERLIADARRAACEVVVFGGRGYPAQLAGIASPPIVLYVRGRCDVLGLTSVAVVGTRRASGYALRVTELMVDGLAAAGVCVVSGMARGIDEAAHRRALKHHTPTIAVLGCGADVCYPPESAALKRSIEEGGAVVSQFAPGERPLPAHFPARNRVISGLSRAVIVVEAAEKSGAMITANYAVDHDRPLFAVPGSVLNDAAAGCNRLLTEGVAVLARNAADVLDELGMKNPAPSPSPRPTDETARAVLDALERDGGFDGGGWLEVEEIVRYSGMPYDACIRALVRMELEGHVLRAPGNMYRARAGKMS